MAHPQAGKAWSVPLPIGPTRVVGLAECGPTMPGAPLDAPGVGRCAPLDDGFGTASGPGAQVVTAEPVTPPAGVASNASHPYPEK